METVDVQKEVLEEVDLLGRKGYFTELRVDKETVPEGMHCYELRHGDDDGVPVSVEESVRVNYFGAVILAEELELGEDKTLQFGYEDFGYTGEQVYLSQVQGKKPEEQHGAEGYETIPTGAGLIKFMEENGISFQMNEKEADLICGYMDGHGYVVGQKDGQVASGYAITAVGIAVKSRSTSCQIGEEVPLVTLGCVVGAFCLFYRSRHLLIVFQCHFTAFFQTQCFLCLCRGDKMP